jgi:hypothetical protein
MFHHSMFAVKEDDRVVYLHNDVWDDVNFGFVVRFGRNEYTFDNDNKLVSAKEDELGTSVMSTGEYELHLYEQDGIPKGCLVLKDFTFCDAKIL